MRITITQIFLFILVLSLSIACQNSDYQENSSVEVDTLQISSLETVISTESQLLAEPREMVSMDTQHFAVYDHGYEKMIIFNTDGEKINEFGEIGEGPGEWSSMSGATDLNYLDERFFTTNRSRFLFDLYDKDGEHIRSMSFPQYMSYSHKTLLPNENLLIATNGRENSLAAILDLNQDGEVIQTIGSPESEYTEERNFEEERIMYANGEIPEHNLNDVLTAKGENGYFLFMNALGELRHYSNEGELTMQQKIPEHIKEPFFNFVVAENKDAPPHSAMILNYARDIQVHNDLIYLFMPKPHPEAEGLKNRILVFNPQGDLLKHYIFTDKENVSFLYNFMVGKENDIYFNEVNRAQVLGFDPNNE